MPMGLQDWKTIAEMLAHATSARGAGEAAGTGPLVVQAARTPKSLNDRPV